MKNNKLILSAILSGLCAATMSCTNTTAPVDTKNQIKAMVPTLQAKSIIEQNGMIVVEAENYASQTLNEKRTWFTFGNAPGQLKDHNFADPDLTHIEGASNSAYLEILPDTRTNHDELLVHDENFTNEPGKMAVLTYPIYVKTPGRYYVWARAFSTGPEDNGMHVGLNGAWPESGQRLQLCKGKFNWTWSSQQRRPENHCGTPNTLWLDIEKPGQHTLMISMREDGTEIDKFILTQDKNYTPEGIGPKETVYTPPIMQERTQLVDIKEYYKIFYATEGFAPAPEAKPYFYIDKTRAAAAINAVKPAARNVFLRSSFTVPKKLSDEVFAMKLVTLSEIDGESSYRVFINDKLVGEYTNAETSVDYSENTFDLGTHPLKQGDTIHVEANAVTNGKIPEGDITAFSRGRWRALVIQHVGE
ncbi:hypothetical protein [Agaribacter flavus]|uniref:Gylcosyl hydrolase 115 C-terminal domain-containing protein n=1 Tax=Agaribacter flavus TaxID=1902781 RepID=A0ABV7FMG3_9ALTE